MKNLRRGRVRNVFRVNFTYCLLGCGEAFISLFAPPGRPRPLLPLWSSCPSCGMETTTEEEPFGVVPSVLAFAGDVTVVVAAFVGEIEAATKSPFVMPEINS